MNATIGQPWKRASVWFLEDGRLRWFAYISAYDAPQIAASLLRVFKRPAVVCPYDWEPR